MIIITSNTDLKSIKTAYDLGCIDYLKKPFHLEELRFKIDRLNLDNKDILNTINLKNNVTLSKKEKNLLLLLLEHKGTPINYQMIDQIVYQDKSMTMDALRTLIRRIRGKLKDDIIKNIIDEGYMIA